MHAGLFVCVITRLVRESHYPRHMFYRQATHTCTMHHHSPPFSMHPAPGILAGIGPFQWSEINGQHGDYGGTGVGGEGGGRLVWWVVTVWEKGEEAMEQVCVGWAGGRLV